MHTDTYGDFVGGEIEVGGTGGKLEHVAQPELVDDHLSEQPVGVEVAGKQAASKHFFQCNGCVHIK